MGPGADGVEGPLEGGVALVEDLEGGVMSEAGNRVGFVESHPDDELFAGVGVFGSSQFRDEFVERGEAEGERLGGVDGTSHCDFDLGSKVRGGSRGVNCVWH